jgi:hypothetical protein
MMKNCDKIFELLKKNQVLVAEATDLLHIPYPDPVFRGFQGGCSDGERYYYQALMHYELSDRTKDYSCIAKIDLRTKQIIKYSGILHLDHANDITYHSKRNLLMVTNNKPNFTRITLIDPDSLDVVGYEEAPVPLYALEYNKSRDMFIAGISGKREFCFLDGDLKLIDDKRYRTIEADDRCTKQDICADNNLLYFILWDGRHKDADDFQNRVTIYDWDGNYRGILEFNLGPEEPESISILGGEIYAVVCNKREPTIYHFEPKVK